MKLRSRITATLAIAVLSSAMLAGCTAGNAAPEATESAANENPYGGFPVDLPVAEDVVLTLSDGTHDVDITMGELIDLSTEEFTIVEPFVETEQTFRGVALDELFAKIGFESGDSIATIALNDYQYVDTAGAFTSNDGILAVFRDGEQIPMDQGGPIRIVFPSDSEYFTVLDAWNWSLRSIELRQ